MPAQQAPPQQPSPQQVQQAPAPPTGGERSPLDAIKEQQPRQGGQAVNLVEVEGDQGNVINQQTIEPGQGAEGLPSTEQGQPAEEQTPIEDSLEDLKEEYDDAKLNSIIIEQVKELIEIDTNLNNKIEDVRVDLKKETEEREKLKKLIEEHHNELKELEKSIDKFIALYELVTNQFNPFVKQGDAETNQKMQSLMSDVQHMQTGGQPAAPQPNMETDFHFVTKTGARVKSVPELAKLLETMDDDEFSHHVNDHKNDFSAWINYAVKNEELAKKVAPLRTKAEMLAALQEAAQATPLNNAGAQQQS